MNSAENRVQNQLAFPLLSDEPSTTDLLSFNAIASTVVDAIFDDTLDPVALGISGSWGSGKTTVLELVKSQIEVRAAESEGNQVLLVPVDPWRFDPLVGPKESLISAVLSKLGEEVTPTTDPTGTARELLKKLAKKVNWSKAIQMAASTAITLQLPKLEDLPDLINDSNDADEDAPGEPRGMDQFRDEFEALLDSSALKHISRVVVIVDDLDRCLPTTVVQTLEAIRLFLSAKRMSFVIAADESRVAEAIRLHLNLEASDDDEGESIAELYLHKIVQTTVPLPALSRVDTQAYLFLLLSQANVDGSQFDELVSRCTELRHTEGSLDGLEAPAGVDLDDQMAIAARLTPILYEKHKGNPRRIKRFLNDLNVRHSVASRRGISLESAATAKLMVLEKLLKDEFSKVLQWLSRNELRDKLDAVQAAANQSGAESPDTDTVSESAAEADGETRNFSEDLIRWAKLPPALDATEVSAYLHLAASFSQVPLVAIGLPPRLRDIAVNLMSSSKVEQQSVSDDVLRALDNTEVRQLIDHLARSTRDQPSIQKFTVQSILRIVDCHPTVVDAVITGLKRLPAKDLTPPTVLLFLDRDEATYQPLYEDWLQGNPADTVRRAIGQLAGSR
ncbi:KAP family P-loop NTPase fold protein [Nocardia rhamnosiphila]|uniref:P-loop NTPase fold protein n=1 Tax=Nocardia rhamnosiphila TaxID=426716 RepID=A0ABV2WIT8_9NOCA